MTVNRFLDGIPVVPILYPPKPLISPPMHVNFTSIHVPNLAKPGVRFIISEKPGSSL